MTRLFAIIPVHNRIGYTRICLNSLGGGGDTLDITVIDDGSSDGTAEMLALDYPRVHVVRGDGNLWWTGAINAGLRSILPRAEASDAVLLLNNDTVLPSDFVERCHEALTRYPNAMIGSVVVRLDDRQTILSGGVLVNWTTAKHRNLNAGHHLDEFPPGHAVPVSVLTGRGVLLPVALVHELGLYWQERLPQYGDLEFPRRAALRGHGLWIDYGMVVYSQPEDPDRVNYRSHYRLSDIPRFFLDRRSACQLSFRFWMAMRSGPQPRATLYFLCDLARVVVHFLRRLSWQ